MKGAVQTDVVGKNWNERQDIGKWGCGETGSRVWYMSIWKVGWHKWFKNTDVNELCEVNFILFSVGRVGRKFHFFIFRKSKASSFRSNPVFNNCRNTKIR